MAIARYPGILHPKQDNLLHVVTQLKESVEIGQRARGRKCDSFIRCDEYEELTNRVVALEEAVNKRYGLLYCTDGDTQAPVVEQTPGVLPVLLTCWTSDGASNGVKVDHTTDTATVKYSGTYELSMSISFSGVIAASFEFEVYKNGNGTGFKSVRKLGTGLDVGSASLLAILELNVNDVISIYVSSSLAPADIATYQAQLWITQI